MREMSDCESRPSSMSFSPFLQNASRTVWFVGGYIFVLNEWRLGHTSLSHVQSIVCSVMKPVAMIF